MKQTHDHTHSHAQDCACAHDHEHKSMSFSRRWFLSILTVGVLLILLRSFIVSQMLVRVTSYATSSSYNDVIRMSKKVIAIEKGNKQAWVSLGYAYMDLTQIDMAIPVFEKVLMLYPEDKGAASYELGRAYYSKGDYAKANGCFERIVGAGPRAGELLEADILKYRHGTFGFRSLNSMQSLLGMLLIGYKKLGNLTKAAEIQKEYDYYQNNHSRILF